MENLFLKELSNLEELIKFNKVKNDFYESQISDGINESVIGYVKDLSENGVVIIPNFMTKTECEYIVANEPPEDKFMLSPEGDKSRFYLNANLNPAFSRFFDDHRIPYIMKGYIGRNAVALRQSMEIRTNIGQVQAFDRMYHMDTWKYRVKAFLYLHDVSENDAPLVYLKRSHQGVWRLPMECKMATQYDTGSHGYASNLDKSWLGCYWPYEVADLIKEHYLEELVCTGMAGSLVIFDARGLHKATDLINSYRKVLISYYIANGNHI